MSTRGAKAVTGWKSGLCAVLAFGVVTALLFGSPLQAVGLLTVWRDRLGLDYWPVLVPVAMGLAVYPAWVALRVRVPRFLGPAVFVFLAVVLSAGLVGFCAEYQRARVVGAFGADVEMRSSIFASYRNAPQEFQFFLHGAALKACKPYAWSYRVMGFYELPADVAVNVLPGEWVEQCDIRRTR
jgi:hypothetical protein